MKLSRSEFIVLREVLKSKEKGLSYNELLRVLRDRLSNQGLSDALKGLQMKSLIYRDFMNKAKGSHAVYRSTATSFDAVYVNDMAEFLVSNDAATTKISLPASRFETNCLYPGVTLISEARETFAVLGENHDFGTKLRDAAQHVISAWLEHKQKSYNEHSLEVVKDYEEALAKYLWLFECQMKKWTPGAVNELKLGPYNYVDPLEMVESAGDIDWPLEKYHIDEEGLGLRKKNFPNADDELSRTSVEGLRKLKRTVYHKEKKRAYEEYLKSLIPPKTVVLMDFRLSAESARKQFTGETESAEYTSGESVSDLGFPTKSAFQEAKERYGKKEPDPARRPDRDEPEKDIQEVGG